MRWRWPWAKVHNEAYTPIDTFITQWAADNGIVITEQNALGISAFYRAVSLISGTLASLPFNSYRMNGLTREQVPSIFDDPDGPDGQTPYEWKETAFLHLLLHGRAGAVKLTNGAGGLGRLPLLHPMSWTIEQPKPNENPAGGRWFRVRLEGGKSERYDATDFWYVPGMSLDGKNGVSLLAYARKSLTTTLYGERAAEKLFANGALISGIATPDEGDEDITDDVPQIRREISRATSGPDNAGKIAVINRRLKFQPWTMSAADAQFLQSRQFQIEEVARWTGVPPHLLMQTEKQTSWGTGVEMQDRALGRTVLNTWSTRFEQRASRLLARPRWAEFDFSALERPSPDKETELDLAQVAAGVMTIDEYRQKRGWKPLPKQEPAPDPGPGDEGDDDAPPAE